jgi:tRNA dimethylallyltransferase
MSGMRRGIVVLAGPTASGKSALALALAESLAARDLGAVLVNADSLQVYRELRVLTARPAAADEERVPHRLYGILAAGEPCSAGRWRAMALAEIAAALEAGRLPIVVGGSGLYLSALLDGLAPVPGIPAAVRAAARARYAALGGERFREELAARDPVTAARLAPGDRQRLVRAWEVVEATGVALAAWHARGVGSGLDLPALKLLLWPERRALYRACEARLEAMFAAGAAAEVARLLAAGLDPELPAMKALGVPALARHLAGEVTLDEAVRLAKQATRRYAKRQATWFRRRYRADLVIAPGPEAAARALAAVERFVLTARDADSSLPAP